MKRYRRLLVLLFLSILNHKIPIAQGIASIATERALDVFSILVLTIIGAIWALQGRVPPEVLHLIIGTAILFVIGLLTLFGITATQASLTVLLLRSVSLWSFIPVGTAVTYIFGFSRVLSLTGKEPDEDQATTATSLPELAEG